MDKTLQHHDLEWLLLDSTVIRAHQHAAGAKKGLPTKDPNKRHWAAVRGGFSTKIHVSVSGLALPVEMRLTPGQEADVKQAEPLLEGYSPEAVIADKAYDSDSLVDLSTRPTITIRSEVSLPSEPRANLATTACARTA